MAMKILPKEIDNFLEALRAEHVLRHKTYEELFWLVYMGDQKKSQKKDIAQKELETFQRSTEYLNKIIDCLNVSPNKSQKESLLIWKNFFELYQTPQELVRLKDEITKIESRMQKKMTTRKEGYVDPKSKKFIKTSKLAMRIMISTHDDEKIRKACFKACEELADTNLDDYILYVSLLNQYAEGLGFEDFYAFKLMQEECMTKKELFAVFDPIYEKTKFAFKDMRELEKKMPGVRKPWNMGYMMSGDFVKEEDQYFPFDEALTRWGQSFERMGVDCKGGTIQLDLLDRKGKYANGFCHWPTIVHYANSKNNNGNSNDDKNKRQRVPGQANFTCNVVYGQVGSASEGYNTLFHEGGHAAHYLNTVQKDTCLNSEYPPASTAWAETQSMFFDTVHSSFEWKQSYAKNKKGETYPLELFERKLKKLSIRRPLGLSSIIMMCNFERDIYECKKLTKKNLKIIARKNYTKFTDMSEDSLLLLNVPHIYSWSSACSYHGYGLAELAQTQWRAYFKKKYGYIVDNKNIGKEMTKVWALGAKHSFKDFIKMATGKSLSPDAWIKESTRSVDSVIRNARNLVKEREQFKKKNTLKVTPINLNAEISMVSGKEKITDNSKSFEKMESDYAKWLNK